MLRSAVWVTNGTQRIEVYHENRIMEEAVSQVTEYISGKKDILIECNDEGELYRLFHEVNSLAAILNAHVENEKNAKVFLYICQ